MSYNFIFLLIYFIILISIGYFSSSNAPANGWLDTAGGISYIARTGLSGYTNFSGSIQ